jgi:hypothetical protein
MKILTLIAFLTSTVNAATIFPDNSLSFGKTGAADKILEFNLTKSGASTNPKIKFDNSLSKLRYSNDGTTFVDIGSGSGGGSSDNKLSNANFESGTAGWTASGGSFASATTSAEVFEGSTAVTWDSSSAAQTLTGTAYTIDGLAGNNAELTCMIRVPSGTATHTIAVWDGTNLVGSQSIVSSSTYQKNTINFIMPSSGTVTARITSVASNEPSISIDDCYIGKARNVGTVAQAVLVGGVVVTGCSGDVWGSSATSFTNFSAVSGCTYSAFGEASAPSTNVPGFKFSSLPPGEYMLQYEGFFAINSASGSSSGAVRFTDGTNFTREISTVVSGTSGVTSVAAPSISQSISYLTAQSNVQFQLQAKTGSGSNIVEIGAGSSGSNQGTFKLYRFPSSSQQAVSVDNSAQSWSGYHTNSGGWNISANTSPVDPAAGSSVVLTQLTNTNFGSVTSAGSSLPGITFTPTKSGTYQVCALAQVRTLSGSAGERVGIALYDGSNNAISIQNVITTPFNNNPFPLSVCANYSAASTSAATIKLRLNSETTASILADSSYGNGSIQWSILSLNQNFPAPLLVGSVTSNSSGLERIERAKITNNGTCAVANQSGNWVTSVVNTATGVCVLTITGFSSAPVCIANTISTTADYKINTTSSSSTSVTTGSKAGTTNTDLDFNIICMGAR